ncbi:MAG: hypothetical protein ABIG84_04675 [archaeon]
MPDYKERMISTLMHTFAGVGMGYVSKDIIAGYGGSTVAFVGAVVLILMNQVVKFGLKKHEFNWWMGNGIWPYLSTWFAVWVIVLNV